ncbi:MAG: DUF3943 domain-containing protein [Bdellovibrio sp.]
MKRSYIYVALSLMVAGQSALARNVQDFEPIQNSLAGSYSYQQPQTAIKKGTLILVDTRDQEACSAIEKHLAALKVQAIKPEKSSLCIPESSDRPVNAVTVVSDSSPGEFRRSLDMSGVLSEERNVMTDTRNLFLASLGVVGALYMMPESVTHWDRNDARNIGTKWKENVKAGPVVDKDSWAINYIGHPVSGAIYYQVARGMDLSRLQSFGYSVIMSTFFWEYGVEAFAEVPSIQDLWSTPVIGSILGELFFVVENRIKDNGGVLFGSPRAGKIAMVLLNPGSALSSKVNQVFGSDLIQDAKFEVFSKPSPCLEATGGGDNHCSKAYTGVRVQFKF